MAGDRTPLTPARVSRLPAPPLPGPEERVTELCTALLSGFQRYEQRIRARQYMDGLLHAQGRKSIANIATTVGVPGDEQRLRHFVSRSHWAVGTVRRALAAFLEEDGPPSAWVALPVSIPKAGEHTVGVSRHLSPDGKHVVNGQRALGVWYASERVVAPVSWGLELSGDRQQAGRDTGGGSGPEKGGPVTPDCLHDLLDDVRQWGSTRRPVLMDARGRDEPRRLAALFAGRAPAAARISGWTPLVGGDRTAPGGRVVAARDALGTTLRVRRGVRAEPLGGRPVATATAAVRLAGAEDRSRREGGRLTLLGVWREPRRAPGELWLTNMDEAATDSLTSSARLLHAVGDGWRTRGAAVGLGDYEGRSLHGWHRHMTLASGAYAMSALSSPGQAKASGLSA
ncbi:IS701 family transposase [Streptomyces cyaneofuscatus]|uniref:IS701 family transposase n=1 Tax=Streptomyces cyaneofuscatus TaxID=66883 RepID=UPI0036631C36